MDYKVTVSDDDVDNIVLSQLKETQKHLINSDCGIPWFSMDPVEEAATIKKHQEASRRF